MKFIREQTKPGGKSFYVMTDGDKVKMYGTVSYIEMTRPNKIVYTQQFCDEHEKMSRHPMAPTWPATMLTTVKLTAEGPERTRVTVTWEPCGDATREEVEAFALEVEAQARIYGELPLSVIRRHILTEQINIELEREAA